VVKQTDGSKLPRPEALPFGWEALPPVDLLQLFRPSPGRSGQWRRLLATKQGLPNLGAPKCTYLHQRQLLS